MFRSPNKTVNVGSFAVAGTTQATAVEITTYAPAFIYAGTSGGDGTAGVRLPKATKGKLFHVKNAFAGNIKVYPATGDAINALGADSALTMASLTGATFVALNSTTWYTLPLLPS